jgi:hypothetical protein
VVYFEQSDGFKGLSHNRCMLLSNSKRIGRISFRETEAKYWVITFSSMIDQSRDRFFQDVNMLTSLSLKINVLNCETKEHYRG